MKKLKRSRFEFYWAPPLVMLLLGNVAVHMTGVFASAEENPISNFHEITPANRCADGQGAGPRGAGTLFRGAAPDEVGLVYLGLHGIKTILNFQTSEEVSAEQELIRSLDLPLIEIPHPMVTGMGVNKLSDGEDDNDSIIAAVADMRRSSNFPEFVHCTYGRDRTGLTVALNRVFNECWSAMDAEKEWNRIEGWFHHLFQIPKHSYFHKVMNDAALHQYYEDQLEKLAPHSMASTGFADVLSAQPMPESSSSPSVAPAGPLDQPIAGDRQ